MGNGQLSEPEACRFATAYSVSETEEAVSADAMPHVSAALEYAVLPGQVMPAYLAGGILGEGLHAGVYGRRSLALEDERHWRQRKLTNFAGVWAAARCPQGRTNTAYQLPKSDASQTRRKLQRRIGHQQRQLAHAGFTGKVVPPTQSQRSACCRLPTSRRFAAGHRQPCAASAGIHPAGFARCGASNNRASRRIARQTNLCYLHERYAYQMTIFNPSAAVEEVPPA